MARPGKKTREDWVMAEGARLLGVHGLNGWIFGLDRAKQRVGACFFFHRRISVSKHYIAAPTVTEADIRDTILHEIAHALAGWQAGHGPEWRAVARRIGCSGEVTAKVPPLVPHKWRIHCPCKQVDLHRHRFCPKYQQVVCGVCFRPLRMDKLG